MRLATARRPTGARGPRSATALASAALAGLALLTACGGSGSGARPAHSAVRGAGSGMIRVPQDASLSAAAKAARPGDVILLAAGTYRQSVQIDTARVTLRGTDRNRTVIDGQVLRANGVVLTGDGDAVQNLTVRNATLNGVLVTGSSDGNGNGIGKGSTGYEPSDAAKSPPLTGFLVDHVTSYNNGLYGVYAFNAVHGLITSTYTSGMADSGLYVGQCKPCNVAVRGNVAERNAVGYEGTNASGNMYVYANRFVGNRVGATTDSDHQEAFVPQNGAALVGNVIAANHRADTPEQADGGFGVGLGIAGGTNNTVSRNLIDDNPSAGVIVTNADDLAPVGNQVTGNDFGDNGVDFAYTAAAAARGSGNCFVASAAATRSPAGFTGTCPARGSVASAGALPHATTAPAGIPFTKVQAPPSQPQLPATSSAHAPATASLPGRVSLASVPVPDADLLAGDSRIRW